MIIPMAIIINPTNGMKTPIIAAITATTAAAIELFVVRKTAANVTTAMTMKAKITKVATPITIPFFFLCLTCILHALRIACCYHVSMNSDILLFSFCDC